MSIFLYMISLALSHSLATSTPISPDYLYQPLLLTNSSSSTPTEFGQRSIWDIVWGCLATIFACSWVSVHPHIPPPDAKWWQISLIRFELMVCTILAPELIILLAGKQWIAARQLKKTYQERGWTITHGFFIQMGGFMLFDGGVRKGVLSPHRFAELIETQEIEFPEITEEEIKDRSKGDGLSKGLVLVQVAWFIIQFAARKAEGLAITQIELATFAFAVMNGFMYLFWWHKPLDIRLPIPIRLLNPLEHNDGIANRPGHFQKRESWRRIVRKAWNARFCIVLLDPDLRLLDRTSVPIFFSSLSGPTSTVHCGYGVATALGMVFGAIHCAGWNLVFPSVAEEYLWRISSVFIVGYPTLFVFRLLLPPLFPGVWGKVWKNHLWKMVEMVFGYGVFFPVYITARLFILFEAVLALRNLPASATYAVQWTTFLPHI